VKSSNICSDRNVLKPFLTFVRGEEECLGYKKEAPKSRPHDAWRKIYRSDTCVSPLDFELDLQQCALIIHPLN